MKRFFKTLYGKISVIFLLLIFIVGGLQIFISVRSSVNYVCEASQKLNYKLASNLAISTSPLVRDEIDLQSLQKLMQEAMTINPRIEVYLLNASGDILAYFTSEQQIKRKKVDLGPIQEFIAANSYERLPIFGDDPLSSTRRKVFSAASVEIGPQRQKGYIYVVLASAKYELASDGIWGSYILSSSALILATTLVFGALAGLFLFFFLTKRLHRMTNAVREFEKGKYDQRINVQSDDEVGELGTAFNHMAGTIERNMRELEKNDTLRRELIANISHDLRSPLASIQGYIETVLMKDQNLTEEERHNYLETILKNVTNLNRLVHELFELSKLDAMQNEPLFEPFSVAELAQDVVLKFQPHAEQNGIHLITKLPVNLPMVYGDIGMIERVLSNLIENALKFTPANGKITIELKPNEDSVEILISDTGQGIPQKDLPYIFDRFYRVEKSRSKESGGSGLGLAIAKKIVAAHHSEINVQSKRGTGTTFVFSLKRFDYKPSQKNLVY